MRTLLLTTAALGFMLAAAANATVVNAPNAGGIDGHHHWHHMSAEKKAEMHKKWEKMPAAKKAEMKKHWEARKAHKETFWHHRTPRTPEQKHAALSKFHQNHDTLKGLTPEQQKWMMEKHEAHMARMHHHHEAKAAKAAASAK
jgi:Spy/CpxP family protein refolding chaperone